MLTFPLYALTILHVHYGLGRHIGCLSPTDIVKSDKIQAVGAVFLMMSALASRVSICLFLLRIFAVNRSWRWTLYFVIALTTCINIACAIASSIQCDPGAKIRDPETLGTCKTTKIGVVIGQIQGGESNSADSPHLSLRPWLDDTCSCLGIPGPASLLLTHVLYVESSNELENQSRRLWDHVSRSFVSLAGCKLESCQALNQTTVLLVVLLRGLP